MTRKQPQVPAAVNEPEATPEPETEVPTINLEGRRVQLAELHQECFKELHRLEGEIRGIDHILTLINPEAPTQPANTAEGEK